jgi:2-polyprenyl-3-methyl-5-hydroxy-6-metoxy-1,4-benzoquinol methylase
MAEDIKQEVSGMANSLLEGKSHIKVLEAGCGSAGHLKFAADVYAVGIDISQQQLEKNSSLQQKILGDIQEYPIAREEFDVAVCWMVLEHLSRPKDALLHLFDSVKPQGLLILAFPNLLSIKGMVTKVTPFWFHEVFYRLMKYTSHPFPTYLRVAILPNKLMRFAEDNGFAVEFCRLVEGGVARTVRSRSRIMDAAFSLTNAVARVVSFGQAPSLFLDNCFMILRKQGHDS